MRRRDLTLLAAIALASPLVTRAQKSVSPMIAFLASASPAQWAPFVAAFRKGLPAVAAAAGGGDSMIALRTAVVAPAAQRDSIGPLADHPFRDSQTSP
ncbi:MAG: hypothetical protein E6H73_00980 [Betaproteobacteria bacterium]|nr:MAG: hypothetical protein E6H73_00980 [Betaproteobacteria bacterium]